MSALKIVIFGVTGNQGASVARALLADGARFSVYGITRNPDSNSSKSEFNNVLGETTAARFGVTT